MVALEDGRVQAFSALEGRISEIEITPKKLPPGMPPLLEVLAGQPRLVVPPAADASPLTAAAALDARAGRLVYIAQNGDLVVWERGEVARLAVDALPDARLLVDERRRILFLSKPTSRYDHSVLGDGLEAASITLVETEPGARVLNSIHVDPPDVFEGIAPIWADLNGDGEREIIATRSDAEKGARVVVFNEDGEMVASGPSIGRGYRWRN